ncbi:hypothetical protein CANARDRAFT_209915 [[Candida] arabinofermentans NRRL YB-2248]|uniref:Uncharacterized protein n=1 Tax=[Candida] arabinofermentans NRRL YB-2248 TaxID=983967 RepID=A0A1E4T792_9ASCO|nr:hypothetical protein CANARDRAFT_209915 [[Candida] arabinofermentans NRRL YB-2248]
MTESIKGLFETYSQRLELAVDTIITEYCSDHDIRYDPSHESDVMKLTIDTQFEDLNIETLPYKGKAASTFFSNLISLQLVSVLPTEDQDLLLNKILAILDISIHLAFTKFPIEDIQAFPMQTLNTIMLTCSLNFVVEQFGAVFFDPRNLQRRLRLTLNNKLTGKNKPGSTLLQIGNNILPRLTNQLREHDIFATRLNGFIFDSFDISDRLLLTADWKLNDFQKTYLNLSKTKKWPISNTTNTRIQRGLLETIYGDYLKVSLYFTSDFSTLIDELNFFKNQKYRGQQPTFIFHMNNILRSLKETDKKYAAVPDAKLEPKKAIKPEEIAIIAEEYATKVYDCDWILDSDDFVEQFKIPKNRRIIALQLYIMLSFLYNYNENKWTSIMNDINSKHKKFKAPDFGCSKLDNDLIKDTISDMLTSIETHYRTTDLEFYKLMRYVVSYGEHEWKYLKLKQFNHPATNDLISLSDFKKRKAEEHLEKCHDVKRPYTHKMGTAKLTKIWSIKTGLDEIKNKQVDAEEKLDSYRDDLYFIFGNLEGKKQELETATEDKKSKAAKELNDLKQEKDLLNWKSLRLARSLGYWTRFSQVNENVGLDGLFDADLILKEQNN